MRPATLADLAAHLEAKPRFFNVLTADHALMGAPAYALGETLERCASRLYAGMRAAPRSRWWMLRDVVGIDSIPYVFERNPARWSHGLFVPVNRSYESLQRGAATGLTEDDVEALQLSEWERSDAIGVQFDGDMVPVYDDWLWREGKAAKWLPSLAILVDRVASRLKERTET